MRFLILLFVALAPSGFAVTVQLPNGVSTTGYIEAVSASGAWIATQVEAEAGVDDTQIMTPLKTKYAIAAQAAAGGGAGMSASFVSSGTEETNTPSATFSGLSFGAAATDRYLLAVVTGAWVNGGRNFIVGSTTIGGVTATKLYEVYGAHRGVSFWLAKVPTGTSGNVAITITENTNGKSVALYRLTGMTEGYRSGGDGSAAGTTQTVSLNIPRNAMAFYGAICGNLNGSATWSGANENYDVVRTGGAINVHTTASVASVPYSIGYPVTQTWSASCGYPSMAGVVLY